MLSFHHSQSCFCERDMQPLKRQYMANVNSTNQHLFIILFQEYVRIVHVSTSQNLFCVFHFFFIERTPMFTLASLKIKKNEVSYFP